MAPQLAPPFFPCKAIDHMTNDTLYPIHAQHAMQCITYQGRIPHF